MKYQLLDISDAELAQVQAKLGAVLNRYRGKSEDGKDIDTIELTRSASCEDLAGSEEAESRTNGTSPSRVDISYENEDFGQVKLRISTRHGSIWFVNAVPEAVIDEVFEVVCEVKGL